MNDKELHGLFAPDPLPRWKRWLQQRLFPQTAMAPLPEDNDPAYAPGETYSLVHVRLDWRDRLRLIFSGQFKIETRHRTDVTIRRISTRSNFNVSPPDVLQR